MKKLLIALLLVAGCAKRTTPGTEETPKVDPPAPEEPTAEKPAETTGEPAAPSGDMKAHPSPEGVITFSVPSAWKMEEPSNNMRKAQYAIPDKEGKAKDGSLTLFFFGPSRTRIEENIKRWKSQVSGGEGEPEVIQGKCKVTLLDLTGDYAGDFGGQPIPNARMLAAVVEAEDGPWYFKVTGPAETIGDWREEFVASLKGAHK